jgi:imidazolonepropionase-like amidohydrolase
MKPHPFSRRVALVALGCALAGTALAQAGVASAPPSAVVLENVRIFDGLGDTLSAPAHVLVLGRQIKTISSAPIADPPGASVTRIAGGGRTLMPGLIDAHTHLMFATVPQMALLTADIGFVNIAAAKGATEMLMRGFTSTRDLGGPVFGLKLAIDTGLVPGPRIWPAGAMVSQSGGHGDFRLPSDLPARPGDYTHGERIGGAAIADDPDVVRKRVREQLALGASHVKLMAGGGVSSSFDPLDVTQYSVPEIRAAVEAAENWGTCVTVHA